MQIESTKLFKTLEGLKKGGFISLISFVAEDLSQNPTEEDKFLLTYTLYNPVTKAFEVIETVVNSEIQSISSLYKSANYEEREIYDLFGIKFKNHPNLKRLFLEKDFEGHPLRNNYNTAETKTGRAL